MSYWRSRCAPIIAKALEDTKGQPDEVRRKAISEAYPFGMRKHHPYKIWLDEVSRQWRGHAPATSASDDDLRRLKEWEAVYGKRSA